jgi:hypothetical protein
MGHRRLSSRFMNKLEVRTRSRMVDATTKRPEVGRPFRYSHAKPSSLFHSSTFARFESLTQVLNPPYSLFFTPYRFGSLISNGIYSTLLKLSKMSLTGTVTNPIFARLFCAYSTNSHAVERHSKNDEAKREQILCAV